MQIPLDYHRILGLPVKAKPEQLQQAHRDRALQLPRREYSELAIAMRRELLDEAYVTLSDPDKREVYDAQFVPVNTDDLSGESTLEGQAPRMQSPQVEIQPQQMVGALLLLQELGEYEQVLEWGLPCLERSPSPYADAKNSEIIQADIALTIALAYLELGREYWHQGHYENAASALEAGQDLLLRDGLFTAVRGEIKNDLYKLRPYRVLELVALPEDHNADRRRGIQILRDMLRERGGIDGQGNDQSGLSIDDFLRFVQQLRDYLTAEEQQSIFQAEARRPSAVATYLAVYALLAQGFAAHQPDQIKQAKTLLVRLGKRQDVHLEQSICALLLGQTEEASHGLSLSREYEAITFIREHSSSSPDLLPGLCLYVEQWLQTEVFPHFRDLAQHQTSLKDYFADEQVQRYLESLAELPADANEWEVVPGQDMNLVASFGTVAHSSSRNSPHSSSLRNNSEPVIDQLQMDGNLELEAVRELVNRDRPSRSRARHATTSRVPGKRTGNNTDPSQATPWTQVPEPANGNRGPRRNQRSKQEIARDKGNSSPSDLTQNRPPQNRPSHKTSSPKLELKKTRKGESSGDEEANQRTGTAKANTKASGKNRRQWLFWGAGAAAISLAVFIITSSVSAWREQSANIEDGNTLESDQALDIRLDRPLIDSAIGLNPDSIAPEETSGVLSEQQAQRLVETWLQAKQEAMGVDHDLESLNQILLEPALGLRRQTANAALREGFYAEYEHGVEIEAVEQETAVETDEATVIVLVNESATFYQNGRLDAASSYNAQDLRVRYDLRRRDDRWWIRDMEVLY